MKYILSRYFWLVLLFLSIAILPWWLVMILCAIFTTVFQNSFEIIAIGLFYDIRFHVPGMHWYLVGLHTLITIGIFVVISVIQKLTRKPDLSLL